MIDLSHVVNNWRPYTLLIPPSLADTADIILNTRDIKYFGNYSLTQYKVEKPKWCRRFSLYPLGSHKPEPHTINDFIRNYYDEESKVSLPKAMRERGYEVKSEYIGMGEFKHTVLKPYYEEAQWI